MPTTKTSFTLDQEVLREARERVGRRGLSRYVNHALRQQLQHDRLAELLDELAQDAGPIDSEVMEEVRRAWPDPTQLESRTA